MRRRRVAIGDSLNGEIDLKECAFMILMVVGGHFDHQSVRPRGEMQRRWRHADLAHVARMHKAVAREARVRLVRRRDGCDEIAVGCQCHCLVVGLSPAVHREGDGGRMGQVHCPCCPPPLHGAVAVGVAVLASAYQVIVEVKTDHARRVAPLVVVSSTGGGELPLGRHASACPTAREGNGCLEEQRNEDHEQLHCECNGR